jgi:hypothetical protein
VALRPYSRVAKRPDATGGKSLVRSHEALNREQTLERLVSDGN